MYNRTKNRARWRWLKLSSLLFSLVIVGSLFVFAIRIYVSLQIAADAGLQFARIVQGSELDESDWIFANEFLQKTTTALARADSDLSLFRPILARLDWVPKLGPSLIALSVTVGAIDQWVDTAQQWLVDTDPSLLTGQSLAASIPTIAATHPLLLSSLITATLELDSQLSTLAPEELVAPVAERMAQLQSAVSLLHGGLLLSEQLPMLLGMDVAGENAQEKHFLVLVQNNYELRATGGFITAIGVLTVRKGEIQDFSVEDSYAFPEGQGPFPPAPLPLRRFMHIDSLLLRDVNWSPDFPATAQLASTLYYQATNQRVDGVLTVDLRAVELMVEAFQSISVGSSPEPITGANLVQRMKEMWSIPPDLQQGDENAKQKWWAQRKDFIPLLARAIINRLKSKAVNPGAIAYAVDRAISERAVQFWSRDLEVEQKLAQLGWDGAISPPLNEDFLGLVDSNLGYNKVDAVLERSLYYQLQWDTDPSGRGLATVLLTYHHPLQVDNLVCEARPEYGDTYDDMMARCYFDFVRLYVPAGSDLVGIDGIDTGSQFEQSGEGGSTVFGGYFTVRPGEEKKIIVQYRLPATITQQNYRLTVRKQAGLLELPFSGWNGTEAMSATIRDGLFVWQATQ